HRFGLRIASRGRRRRGGSRPGRRRRSACGRAQEAADKSGVEGGPCSEGVRTRKSVLLVGARRRARGRDVSPGTGKSMNVAVFASSFYPHLGGVEELVRQLCKEYRRRGHEVVVITNRWPPSLPERSTYGGTPVYRIPMRVPDGPRRARIKFQATHRRLERQAREILLR